ncbi:MAG: tRNA (N6-isopentenyl adenosine(37)-C2)-methylthiotransferase MiaB [Spirochaetia bacterium]|nr:tRNA (N6-isopentenyl adenosine(37)-C2)-methylthiotransferase MiaB [Spirochaetia bacterium]
MHKVYIKTFGCQMNEYDSERMAGILSGAGYTITQDEHDADYIIVNTCSVRQHAEERAISFIGAASKKHKVIVAGCMAQRLQDDIIKRFPGVKAVVGTFNFAKIAEIIKEEKRRVYAGEEQTDVFNIRPKKEGEIRGFTTVMQGCDNFCSYCIVPYVRGRERSRDKDSILEELGEMGKMGYKEVMLLGQNVNSYFDRKNSVNFSGLLREAVKVDGIKRIKFMTSHPKDLSDELIETVAAEPKLARHFHLPLQSGSDRVLKLMNRKYTAGHFMGRVEKIRELIPGCSITTDILVGFSGEEDADFLQTVQMAEKIKFDAAYIFKYSVRKGTAGEKMEDSVNEKVKLERLNNILELQKKISENMASANIGREMDAIICAPGRADRGLLEAVTDTNKTVLIPAGSGKIGDTVRVRVTGARRVMLEGEVI